MAITTTWTTSAAHAPVNWQKGWQGEWRIAGGGTETPYLHHGRWYLRVFNVHTQTVGIYDFSNDIIEADITRASLR